MTAVIIQLVPEIFNIQTPLIRTKLMQEAMTLACHNVSNKFNAHMLLACFFKPPVMLYTTQQEKFNILK